MAAIVLAVLLSGLGNPSAQPAAAQLRRLLELRAPDSLKDFRVPETADLTGDWAAHPRSFVAQADFDGDSRTDTAVLLIRRSGPGFRLLVVFGRGGASVLEDQVWQAQGFGLSVARPGRYRTAA